MAFCIGVGFTEKKLAYILVKSSLPGQYQLEFDTIYLQWAISGDGINNFLSRFLILSV